MDGNNILSVIAAIADGLLLGAPSSALMSDIVRDYNISLAKARQLVNKLSYVAAQNQDDLQKIANKEYDLQSLLYNYPMMGAITESIQHELSAVRSDKKQAEKAVSQAQDDLRNAEDTVTSLEHSAPDPKQEAQKFLHSIGVH